MDNRILQSAAYTEVDYTKQSQAMQPAYKPAEKR
jgi:hypothetical protein